MVYPDPKFLIVKSKKWPHFYLRLEADFFKSDTLERKLQYIFDLFIYLFIFLLKSIYFFTFLRKLFLALRAFVKAIKVIGIKAKGKV